MQTVLVYSPLAATRKLYHQSLNPRDYLVYPVQDLAEFLLMLATFSIDAAILVDEGWKPVDLDRALKAILKKYPKKRIIVVSKTFHPTGNGVEHFLSNRSLLDRFT